MWYTNEELWIIIKASEKYCRIILAPVSQTDRHNSQSSLSLRGSRGEGTETTMREKKEGSEKKTRKKTKETILFGEKLILFGFILVSSSSAY